MIFIIMCVLFSLSLFKELSFLIFPILFFFPLILIILAFDIYFDFLQLRRVEKAHQCLREIEKLKNYENISIEEINKELNQYFLLFNFKKIKKDQIPFQYLTSLARSPPHLSFLARFTEAKVGDELLIGAGAALRAW